MMVFISNRKLHVSAYSDRHQVFDNFLAIRVIYNMHKPRGVDEISTSPRDLCILYITLTARKLSKPDDGRCRPKHVVFYC